MIIGDYNTDGDGNYLTAFSHCRVKDDIAPMDVIQVANSLDKLDCAVHKTNGWKELPSGMEFHLKIDRKTIRGNCHPKQFWVASSEHLVFFADLFIGESCLTRVIVKFHLVSSPNKPGKRNKKQKKKKQHLKRFISPLRRKHKVRALVVPMTREHCEGIIRNYNDLRKYLHIAHKEGLFEKISVVNVCIASTIRRGWFYNKPSNNIWIEEYLDGFQKLWNDISWYQQAVLRHADACHEELKVADIEMEEDLRDAPVSARIHNHLLACTDIPELQELQEFIYQKTEKKRTLCDIQGQRNKVLNSFILCDIEFTDTLEKFGYDRKVLLKEYVKSRNNEAAGRERTVTEEFSHGCTGFWEVIRNRTARFFRGVGCHCTSATNSSKPEKRRGT
jgi:hypothetical protein